MLTKCQALFWALYYFTCFNAFNPHNNLVGKMVSLLLPYSWWIWAAQNNLPMVLQLVRFNKFFLNEWINEQMIECMNRGARTMEGIVWGSGRKGRKRKVTSAVIRLISRFLPLTSPFFLPTWLTPRFRPLLPSWCQPCIICIPTASSTETWSPRTFFLRRVVASSSVTLGEDPGLPSLLLVLQGILEHMLSLLGPHFRTWVGDWDSSWVFWKVLSLFMFGMAQTIRE